MTHAVTPTTYPWVVMPSIYSGLWASAATTSPSDLVGVEGTRKKRFRLFAY